MTVIILRSRSSWWFFILIQQLCLCCRCCCSIFSLISYILHTSITSWTFISYSCKWLFCPRLSLIILCSYIYFFILNFFFFFILNFFFYLYFRRWRTTFIIFHHPWVVLSRCILLNQTSQNVHFLLIPKYIHFHFITFEFYCNTDRYNMLVIKVIEINSIFYTE